MTLDLLAALRSGTGVEEAWLRVRRFEELRARAGAADNVAVVKEALHQRGLCRPDVRPPGHVLGPDAAAEVAAAIAGWP